MAAVFVGFAAAAAWGQYPGRVAKTGKPEPVLRSVAVLEWTGEAGKPSASRVVPVTVFDGEQLNDGTIYLSRPEPLAVASGVEYELQTAGKPMGLFDVFAAGEVNGAWQGFGAWKPLTKAAAEKAKNAFNTSSLMGPVDLPDDDHPVLKRKHPKESDAGEAKPSGTDAGAGKAADVDPDRPTLKKKSSDDAASADPNGPKLKRKSDDDSSTGSGSTASVDPDRPTIRRNRRVAADEGVSTAEPDPDRPRLKRGKPADYKVDESPKLVGLPPTMQQAVAVSDARTSTEHPWKYTWANPEDETKMKVALEGMARTALGLVDAAQAKATAKSGAKGSTAAHRAAKVSMLPGPEPVALADEQFRVFELTYGATATMVLTASTPKAEVPVVAETPEDGPPVIKRGKPVAKASTPDVPTAAKPVKPPPQKFVTLIAQPDLYGGVLVLFKSVTDSEHLDEHPRMRLVDAVDAMGDNRGELLFELRGAGQRQFAMYRVLRGSAEQLFATVAIP
jgi:hypothetical protein